MRGWISAGVLFFLYIAAVSLVLRGLRPRTRWLATGGALAGLVVCAAAEMTPHHRVLHGWILPPVILLLAYWTSGLLFVAPMARAEQALESIDACLRIDQLAARSPRWLAELLEVAYIGVYPVIPLALAIHLLTDPHPGPDRFWTVILVTDFICFGFLPWVQTRPPRAFRSDDPWVARARRVNLDLLGKTSINVNTFPSGHAAEALAAALLVANAPWPLVVLMSVNAALISAGAVLGRYHYAADALTGWAVALGVWCIAMTHFPLVPAFAALVAWSMPQAQAPPAPAASVRLDVVAVDDRGAPVTDLKPAELEVWISGYRVPIADVSAVTPESHKPTIVLLLDNTAVGPTIVPRLKEAARHFVNGMKPGDELAILPLDGGALAFTGDRQQLLQAIDAFYPRGFPFRPEDAGEDVLGTMEALARRLEERTDGRKIIVGIGAGWIFDRPLPPPGVRDLNARWVAAMRAMAAANASLYVLDPAGVGAVSGAGALGGESGFARETGGYAFLHTNDLRGAADRIRAEAGTYYILRTANPPVQRTADLREVNVKVLRQGVTVRARRGIKGRP